MLFLNAALMSRKARKLEGQHTTFTDAELDSYGNTFARIAKADLAEKEKSQDL